MKQMEAMKPTTGFGETFQYSNLLVSAGGYAAARAFTKKGNLEDSYSNAMKQLVFEPLEMRNTFLKSSEALAKDAAYPNSRDVDDQIKEIPVNVEGAVYSVAPAGAVWSNTDDIEKYIIMELKQGVGPRGQAIIGKAALLKRRKKWVKSGEKSYYGLGLMIADDEGLNIIGHGGNTLGFSSDMFFMPEKELGVVILTNAASTNAFMEAVKRKIIELEFGAEPRAEKAVQFSADRQKEAHKLMQARTSVAPDKTKWIEKLVGDYSNPDLGSAKLSKVGDQYEMTFSDWKSQVGSYEEKSGDHLLALVAIQVFRLKPSHNQITRALGVLFVTDLLGVTSRARLPVEVLERVAKSPTPLSVFRRKERRSIHSSQFWLFLSGPLLCNLAYQQAESCHGFLTTFPDLGAQSRDEHQTDIESIS